MNGVLHSITFTGTRKGMTANQIIRISGLVLEKKPGIVRHGGAVGADTEFHEIAKIAGAIIWVFPGDQRQAQNFRGRKECQVAPVKPYLERNRTMVDCAEIVIAAPGGDQEELRSGTWATIRYSKACNIPTYIVFPSGRVELFNEPK